VPVVANTTLGPDPAWNSHYTIRYRRKDGGEGPREHKFGQI